MFRYHVLINSIIDTGFVHLCNDVTSKSIHQQLDRTGWMVRLERHMGSS